MNVVYICDECGCDFAINGPCPECGCKTSEIGSVGCSDGGCRL